LPRPARSPALERHQVGTMLTPVSSGAATEAFSPSGATVARRCNKDGVLRRSAMMGIEPTPVLNRNPAIVTSGGLAFAPRHRLLFRFHSSGAPSRRVEPHPYHSNAPRCSRQRSQRGRFGLKARPLSAMPAWPWALWRRLGPCSKLGSASRGFYSGRI